MHSWEDIPAVRNLLSDIDKKPATIRSISRATSILFCLSNGINTVTDISRHCLLSTSTVHRLLKALQELRWVIQDNVNRRYYLGPLVTRLVSNPLTTHQYLVMHAIEEMKKLTGITKETVALVIMVGIEYISLYEIPSRHDLRLTDENQRGVPLFIEATAKVLLSQLGDDELDTTLKNIRIDRVTENTVTDKKLLLEQVKYIRQTGYAVSDGERITGGMGISAAIRNYVCPAALSILGPRERISPKVAALTEALLVCTSRISDNIGNTLDEGGESWLRENQLQ
jgi:DNA-binding IclR family transcriptional regulator